MRVGRAIGRAAGAACAASASCSAPPSALPVINAPEPARNPRRVNLDCPVFRFSMSVPPAAASREGVIPGEDYHGTREVTENIGHRDTEPQRFLFLSVSASPWPLSSVSLCLRGYLRNRTARRT